MTGATRTEAERLVGAIFAGSSSTLAAGGVAVSALFRRPLRIPAQIGEQQLGSLVQLGEGNQAVVYRSDFHNLLYKRYHSRTGMNPAALSGVVSWRLQLGRDDRDRVDATTSWPLAVVVDAAHLEVGVVMAAAPTEFTFVRATDGQVALLELQHLAVPGYAAILRTPIPDTPARLRIARDLAETVELFERHEIVHGDFSFTNLLYGPTGRCFVLDCDGVRLGSRPTLFPGLLGSNEWADPDRPTTGPDLVSQRWQLAAAVGRIVGRCGWDVTAGRWRIVLPRDLPAGSREFTRWLLAGLGSRPGRPTADEWARMLASVSTP